MIIVTLFREHFRKGKDGRREFSHMSSLGRSVSIDDVNIDEAVRVARLRLKTHGDWYRVAQQTQWERTGWVCSGNC